MNNGYNPISGAKLLAMGASEFVQHNPLPAVPIELQAITSLWSGQRFLNSDFTAENLMLQRRLQPYQMIHLATHSQFNPGNPDNSYIQLWDQAQLRLSELPMLRWSQPIVELLVLSSCNTALGNQEAELGFAGLAAHSGVRSVVATLWSVSDEGTLALMTSFYQQLQTAITKSDALREAQIALLRGEVSLANNELVTLDHQMPPSLNLTHPYYWSGFTMIGNPW